MCLGDLSVQMGRHNDVYDGVHVGSCACYINFEECCCTFLWRMNYMNHTCWRKT